MLSEQETLQESPVEQKKFQSLNKEKHGFIQNTKVFINENLTLMNENIAFTDRKLKCSGFFNACFAIDGIVRIKKPENSKPLKAFHIKNLRELFLNFNFDVDEDFSMMHLKMQKLFKYIYLLKYIFWIIFTVHFKLIFLLV